MGNANRKKQLHIVWGYSAIDQINQHYKDQCQKMNKQHMYKGLGYVVLHLNPAKQNGYANLKGYLSIF